MPAMEDAPLGGTPVALAVTETTILAVPPTATNGAELRTIEVSNSAATAANVTIHIVPSGGTAAAGNALLQAAAVPANGTLSLVGLEVPVAAGATVSGLGSAVGLNATLGALAYPSSGAESTQVQF